MIVKMKHLDLVCVAEDREATLDRLRSLGAVHLDLAAASGAEVAAAKGDASEAEAAVRFIMKARDGKTPAALEKIPVSEVLSIQSTIEDKAAQASALSREIVRCEPYGDFDPGLARKLIADGVDIRAVAEFPDPLPE